MSINFKSTFEFSDYIDKDNICIFPEAAHSNRLPSERFYLYIPYDQRLKGPVATVIMYNPSKAGFRNAEGKVLSDFTIYNVLQYLYHHKDKFKGVRVLNLFSSYSSNPAEVSEVTSNLISNKKVLKEMLCKNDTSKGDKIILGWGDTPKKATDRVKYLYREQISYIESIIGNQPVYHVVDPYRKSLSPQHGSRWTDYEKLKPFNF
ncbi:DUF1643 domain-containing protein [Salimicrobium sp. PL1-032A]|uniref:DUF1643 domain-containing protein n=1 Tax=Salimicrobium sp. PL1-032A TaxID=3095364 RepID=UPI0032605B53